MKNFVVIDGNECLGKTKIAKEVCKLTGYKYQKFPNEKNEFGKIIREILQGKRLFEPYSFQAINAIDKQLTPIISNTIADRYLPSQWVYGKLYGVSDEFLEQLNLCLPKPDITFIFTGVPFCKDTEIFGNKMNEIEELYEDYIYLNQNTQKIIKIDVNKPIEETIDEIIEFLFLYGK